MNPVQEIQSTSKWNSLSSDDEEVKKILDALNLSLNDISPDKQKELIAKIQDLVGKSRTHLDQLSGNPTLHIVGTKLETEIRSLFTNFKSFQDSTLSVTQALDRSDDKINRISSLVKGATKKTFDFFIPEAHASDEPRCERPTFSDAYTIYKEVLILDDFVERAGGRMKQNYDSRTFVNGCAGRVSLVLNETGCPVPAIPGKTVSGKNGEQYIYRLSDLKPHLRHVYGSPDCEWKNGKLTKESKPDLCANLNDKKGILLERFAMGRGATATGHAQVTDFIFGPPTNGVFYELPDD